MDENPGVTPIFDTIMPKSSGATASLTMALNLHDFLLRDIKSGPGRRFHIDDKLPGVGSGEKRDAE